MTQWPDRDCYNRGMQRLARITDIHLDFLYAGRVRPFSADVVGVDFDAFMILGDIGDARNLVV